MSTEERENHVTRREFLKEAAVVGASAAAAGLFAGTAVTSAPVEASPGEGPSAARVAAVEQVDVVVVGAGAAGMWAALEAANAGAKVALLEKQ
jgi:heterodisulfide reductase subunit A-like polyferredoxin